MTPQHHRFQLWAYAKATERSYAHIAYLRHDYLHTFSTANLAATNHEAQTLVQHILAEHYPTVSSPANCRWCPYGEFCAERHQGETLDTKS